VQLALWLAGLIAISGTVQSVQALGDHASADRARLQQTCPEAVQDGRGACGWFGGVKATGPACSQCMSTGLKTFYLRTLMLCTRAV
jgi:hypothetical protein